MGWSRRVFIKFKSSKTHLYKGASYYSYEIQRSNKQEYYLTEADFPIANSDDLSCIAKELNQIPSKETAKNAPDPIKTYLQRITLKIAFVDSEINYLVPLDRFLEMDPSLKGIEEREFGVTDTLELGIIYWIKGS